MNKQADALEKLFALYERQKYYYPLKITTGSYMTEDAVQDAFCKMIKYIDSLNYKDDRKVKKFSKRRLSRWE